MCLCLFSQASSDNQSLETPNPGSDSSFSNSLRFNYVWLFNSSETLKGTFEFVEKHFDDSFICEPHGSLMAD